MCGGDRKGGKGGGVGGNRGLHRLCIVNGGLERAQHRDKEVSVEWSML